MPTHAPSLLLLSLRSDIKPENIMLQRSEDGTVVRIGVIDFGAMTALAEGETKGDAM